MSQAKLNNYVSEIDQFLRFIDDKTQLSATQLKEKNKHQRIARLRDEENRADETIKLWDNF